MQSKQVLEWQSQARVEGHVEGRAEGMEQGELLGRIHTCQRLLGQSAPSRQELLQMPNEDLNRLAEQLEARLLPRTNGNS